MSDEFKRAVERIRKEVSLSDVAGKFGLKLERDGDEFVACCPFHSEDTPSFTLFTGKDHVERFYCFGCGDKGDVIDFVQKIKGETLREAMETLGGKSEFRATVQPREIKARDVYEGIRPIAPPDAPIETGKKLRLYNPKRAGTEREWGSFAPSMVFPYRMTDGSLFGYVLRHNLPDGGKETPMVMFVRLPDGKETWCRFPFPKPRPLYRVETIGDARQVIVVEGEKKADKLAALTGRVVIAWAGGTQGARHADWSPISGRNIVMWRDFDPPGELVQDEIGGIVTDLGCTFRVLEILKAA